MIKLFKMWKLLPDDKKKKVKKHIRRTIISIVLIVCLVFYFFIMPMLMYNAMLPTLGDIEFSDKPENMSVTSPYYNGGITYSYTGGLAAMGIDFDSIIAQYAANTADDETLGKLIYAQALQLADAQTLATGHPILMLTIAMGIREMGLFTPKSSGGSCAAKFMSYNYGGQTQYRSMGMYGSWMPRGINGSLQDNNDYDSGIIPHSAGGSVNYGQASGLGAEDNLTLTLKNYQNPSETITVTINQKKKELLTSDGNPNGYNKGAYGPLQIEADQWITFVAPARDKAPDTDSNLPGYSALEGWYNIPMTEKKFNSYQAGLKHMIHMSDGSNLLRSIITTNNDYIKGYKNNQEYVNNIMSTVGHPNYINDYLTATTGADVFKADKYVFADRFTDASKAWDDWCMSTESFVHAFTLLPTHAIGQYCYFDNAANIKSRENKVAEGNAMKDRDAKRYGDELKFANRTAEEIYWVLEMLQTWNSGCPSYLYYDLYKQKPNENDKSHGRDTAYMYKEIANYIATKGPDYIINHADYKSKITGGSSAIAFYREIMDYVMKENGTDPSSETAQHISDLLGCGNTVRYAYAVSGLLEAYTAAKPLMQEIFGINDFNLFGYGQLIQVNLQGRVIMSGTDHIEIQAVVDYALEVGKEGNCEARTSANASQIRFYYSQDYRYSKNARDCSSFVFSAFGWDAYNPEQNHSLATNYPQLQGYGGIQVGVSTDDSTAASEAKYAMEHGYVILFNPCQRQGLSSNGKSFDAASDEYINYFQPGDILWYTSTENNKRFCQIYHVGIVVGKQSDGSIYIVDASGPSKMNRMIYRTLWNSNQVIMVARPSLLLDGIKTEFNQNTCDSCLKNGTTWKANLATVEQYVDQSQTLTYTSVQVTSLGTLPTNAQELQQWVMNKALTLSAGHKSYKNALWDNIKRTYNAKNRLSKLSYDCSSFVSRVYKEAGYTWYATDSSACSCDTLADRFVEKKILVFSDSKDVGLTSDPEYSSIKWAEFLQPGDIILFGYATEAKAKEKTENNKYGANYMTRTGRVNHAAMYVGTYSDGTPMVCEGATATNDSGSEISCPRYAPLTASLYSYSRISMIARPALLLNNQTTNVTFKESDNCIQIAQSTTNAPTQAPTQTPTQAPVTAPKPSDSQGNVGITQG